MQKILIFGHQGYIGPVLGRYLQQRYPKAQLIGVDMGYFESCYVHRDLKQQTAVFDTNILADVRQLDSKVFEGVDGVVMLSAISNDPMGAAFEQQTHHINCDAVLHLAREAKKSGVKHFVFASSCSVYGAGGQEAKTENDSLMPLTAYAQSKIACEVGLEPLADENFLVSALRFATACGFSPRLRLDLVLNDFVASALLQKRIEILSDGTPLRPLIDVNDMARAIEWGLVREHNNGGAWVCVNAGCNSWNFSVHELALQVAQHFEDVDVQVNTQAAPDKRSYRVDFSRFASLAPQHQPQHTLQETIAELKKGLELYGFDVHNFRQSHLIRLHTLKGLIQSGQLDENLKWV